MRIYSKNKDYKLFNGNMQDMLEVIEPNTIDSIVTDPPYGLTSITKRFGKENSAPAQYGKDGAFSRLSKGFMGKEWDGSGVEYDINTWKQCYEVLKPGGYLLAFGGSRTYHRIACAIEDAGFEIRDTIMWLYGSGFPKSHDLGLSVDKKMGIESIDTGIASPNARPNSTKDNTLYESGTVGKDFNVKIAQNEWNGWGTQLKPSFEPIIVARKPFKGSLVDNVLNYGVGGLNIDECRVATQEIRKGGATSKGNLGWEPSKKTYTDGRFPANTILTYDDSNYEEVCGGFPNTKSNGGKTTMSDFSKYKGSMMNTSNLKEPSARKESNYIAPCDSGSASRYFYCAKASKKDRDEGLEELESKPFYTANNNHGDLGAFYVKKAGGKIGDSQLRKNTHPTVKPTELMQYLVRLVTPNGGTVLDPFNGSGSTGKAVMYENKERNKNYKYIGIELTEEYLPIAKARIEYVCNKEEKQENQTNIYDFMENKND